MDIITKYDYCQGCHLLLSECRCDSNLKAVTATKQDTEQQPIWLSTWTFQTDKGTEYVYGVVAKGENKELIKKNPIYLNRALRNIKSKATVLQITLDKQLGYGIKE